MIETRRHGLMIAMIDVDRHHEEEFNRWYDEEHFPERIACPGFISGHRYQALEGQPKYLAVYELETPDVLQGEAYLKLREPSPWTLHTREHITQVIRNVYVDITPPLAPFYGRKK
jgi:hypothetical protein